ncbi:hypothetical protein GDO86_004708 [Hymenochirus boettgeri]|uniref:Fibrinogen C-terminal domain-containing protein n=1 Tax=Hymenochirus boettgeri TaxID=247094 RepID=A0A8T2K8S3_9PIPI|nr:hypothetical protein GDO86_004708 [Hymenochirus boettgeri]
MEDSVLAMLWLLTAGSLITNTGAQFTAISPCTEFLKGDPGIQGPEGSRGIQGTDGAKGDKGEIGNTGLQGLKGDSGDVVSGLYVGRNCKELLNQGVFLSGWYTIYPDGLPSMKVLCDMDTDDGGWIVFQRRYDGSLSFSVGWDSFKRGFGSRLTEFWLGNDYLHNLTLNGTWELRVDLRDFNNNAYYAKYSFFYILDESGNYTLRLGPLITHTAGDSLGDLNNAQFSTKDRDNSGLSSNPAITHNGAWWHNANSRSNLNGFYFLVQSNNITGVFWVTAQNNYYSYKFSEMKIRPV